MALLDPVYAVGDGHGRFPVRDKDDGLFVLLIPEGLEDDALVDAVDIACRLVEQYEPAAPQEGAAMPMRCFSPAERPLPSAPTLVL